MSKKLLIALAVFGVDVFMAFAWLFYTQTPTAVLAEARRRMAATTSVRMDINLEGEGSFALPTISDFLRGVPTASDRFDALKLRATADLDLTDLGAIKRQSNFRITIAEKEKAEPEIIEGEFRGIARDRYLRLDEFPSSPALADAVRGTWLTLTPQILDVPFLRPGALLDVPEPLALKLRSLFRSTRFIHVEKELPEGTIHGDRHYRYAVQLRPDAIRGFRIVSTNLREQRSLTEDDLTRLDGDLARWSVDEAELWIRKRDFFLSRAVLSGSYDHPETGTSAPFSATMNLTRWNEPVAITPPEQPKAIRGILTLAGEAGLSLAEGRGAEEVGVLSAEYSGFSAAKNVTSTPASEDDDEDGLSNTLESFYRSDPLNPDSDGDGYQDGFEVNNGFDPMGPGQLFNFRP